VLERGDLARFGEILHEAWQYKKRLSSSITSPRIEEAYERARRAGAAGGKITGAGGGGFLLLYCEPPRQPALCAEMEALGLYRMDFHFDSGGAKVLMNSSPHAVGSQVLAA
jgi:D-glycero-alpha-D-manno-heptose-7-phosphate kinase